MHGVKTFLEYDVGTSCCTNPNWKGVKNFSGLNVGHGVRPRGLFSKLRAGRWLSREGVQAEGFEFLPQNSTMKPRYVLHVLSSHGEGGVLYLLSLCWKVRGRRLWALLTGQPPQ